MVAFISDSERYQLALRAGFQGSDAVTATAISIAENPAGDPAVMSGRNKNGTYDLGLWQINSAWWAQFGGQQALTDGLINARAAYQVFLQQGFNAWCTYWPTGCGGYNANDPRVQLNWNNAVARAQAIAGSSIQPPISVDPQDPPRVQPPGTTAPGNTIVPVPATASMNAGLGSAILTLIAPFGAAVEKLGVKPDFSGVILLIASIFAIIIGALVWRGDDVKQTVKNIPREIGAAAEVAAVA
jgi:hypothetical protein